MFVNMGGMFGEEQKHLVEVWLGNEKVQSQIVVLPSIVAQQEFMGQFAQIANHPSPMRIKISYFDITDEGKKIENYLEFQNKSWERAYAEGEGQ